MPTAYCSLLINAIVKASSRLSLHICPDLPDCEGGQKVIKEHHFHALPAPVSKAPFFGSTDKLFIHHFVFNGCSFWKRLPGQESSLNGNNASGGFNTSIEYERTHGCTR
jgi:hypothetical protein